MKKISLILFITAIFCMHSTFAQSDSDNKQYIKVSAGFGSSFPFDDVDVSGSGFYAQGEYVYEFYNWLDVRPYAGVVFANSKEEDNAPNEAGFKSDANAFLLGGKARLTAPIPWVAPYIELGIGLSAGKFETITNDTAIDKSGLQYHIPLSFGLELGPKHNFDIGLTYFIHPSAEQFVGSFTFGVTFPLN